MVPLALVLLVFVAIVVVSAVTAGDGQATLNLVGADIVTSERGLFLAGVVSAGVAGLALWLLFKGLQQAKKRRSEMHQLRDAAARPSGRERDDKNAGRRRPDSERRPDDNARPGHPSTGPGRGVRSPTDPGEYHGPASRPDDDDHFGTLPRD